MYKTDAPFNTDAVTTETIQRAVARAHRLRSQEITRQLRAAGNGLRRLADAALHLRTPAGVRNPTPCY